MYNSVIVVTRVHSPYLYSYSVNGKKICHHEQLHRQDRETILIKEAQH